jgi:hypothetical protein
VATFVSDLYSPMKMGIVAIDGRQPAKPSHTTSSMSAAGRRQYDCRVGGWHAVCMLETQGRAIHSPSQLQHLLLALHIFLGLARRQHHEQLQQDALQSAHRTTETVVQLYVQLRNRFHCN